MHTSEVLEQEYILCLKVRIAVKQQSIVKIVHDCPGSGWDGFNFHHNTLYGAMFNICHQNSADNTPVF